MSHKRGSVDLRAARGGTAGYVVLDDRSWPLAIGTAGVLWVTTPLTATVFPSRARARVAVDHRRRYAHEHGFPWGNDYKLVRLVPHVERRRG